MSNMLADIVTAALVQAHDFTVVGNIGEDQDLFSQIHQTGAGAVIVQARASRNIEPFLPLLHTFPALTVVAIGTTGSGYAHRLRPYTIRIAELSADSLKLLLRTGSGQRPPSSGPKKLFRAE
jgi:hypothetical protein